MTIGELLKHAEQPEQLNHMMLNLEAGVVYQDAANTRKQIKLIGGENGEPWICRPHVDGHWVSLRPATQADIDFAAKQLSPRRG